jgi:hypothetical protein
MTSLENIRTAFNGSVQFEARPEQLTSNSGALVLRQIIEFLGLRCWLNEAAPRRGSRAASGVRFSRHLIGQPPPA